MARVIQLISKMHPSCWRCGTNDGEWYRYKYGKMYLCMECLKKIRCDFPKFASILKRKT